MSQPTEGAILKQGRNHTALSVFYKTAKDRYYWEVQGLWIG